MKRIFTVYSFMLILSLLIVVPVRVAHAAGVCYVKWDASGLNNGTSWENAYTDLQSALGDSPCTQVWVAQGTYKPTAGPDRGISFVLKSGLSLYGGFVGSEADLGQRDPAAHPTILSGDIGAPGNDDNTYHVVTAPYVDNTARLDGFTITGGNSNWDGGGMDSITGSPTVANVIFSNNSAHNCGGGMYSGVNSQRLENVTFSGNSALFGGGICIDRSNLSMEKATFSDNTAGNSGGGLHDIDSILKFVNVTISDNWAGNLGGGMRYERSSSSMLNVTFSGNFAANLGGAIYNADNSTTTITNGILYGDIGGEIYNNSDGSNVAVMYSIVQGDYAGTGNLDLDPLLQPLGNYGGLTETMALGLGSPAMDAGTNDGCPATDQRGVPRPFGNGCDMGAYEVDALRVKSVARTSPNPTGASTLGFTVRFELPVIGVDMVAPFSDFGLTTEGLTGAAITSVTGSGDTYAVTVNVGMGAGTVRLDVLDDDSIFDLNGNPLGGPGNGNGDFVDGPAYTIVHPKVVSILPAGPNPSAAYNVRFTVKFSEAVTGVDTLPPFSDFRLATGGLTGAAITAVTGSAGTYKVTIKTGSGTGFLRLNLLDDDSILDSSGNPLGGPGLGNGNFTAGPQYAIVNPRVVSILRVESNPNSVAKVTFTVKFSLPVTGVDKMAPFPDFALQTTGVSGAAILAIDGSGADYTVWVKTGQGNGSIRLNLLDDGSIKAVFGRPLGGPGPGNGNFTGPAYSIRKIPIPQAPGGTSWDRTPTYQWSSIPGALEYSLEVWTGTRRVYSLAVPNNICINTTCTFTPAYQLLPGEYQWRVRALVPGTGLPFSSYKTFTVAAPKAGFWKGSWNYFYVTPDRTSVTNFSIYVYVTGCGSYRITQPGLTPIADGKFGFGGAFYANGTFATTATSASGIAGLSDFFIPGCGPVSGGPFHWTATWQNSSEAGGLPDPELGPIVIPLPELEGFIPEPFTIDPIQP